MDNIKERADEICVFLIDNPETETFDLLELLYPRGKLSQEDKAVLETTIEKLNAYGAGFDDFDRKIARSKMDEYTKDLHRKDRFSFLIIAVACVLGSGIAIWNATDTEIPLFVRIFGIVAMLAITIFAHWACSSIQERHNNPEKVFEMCCEDLGLNENEERAHRAIQRNIKDIRRFLGQRA